MSSQIGIPVDVRPEEVARKASLGSAIELCAELGGFELDKQLSQALAVDKAQFSRWTSGTEGIVWQKLERLMEMCGNDAPLLWMMHQRGWDLHSLRKRESETERMLRLEREENAELQKRLNYLEELTMGRRSK